MFVDQEVGHLVPHPESPRTFNGKPLVSGELQTLDVELEVVRSDGDRTRGVEGVPAFPSAGSRIPQRHLYAASSVMRAEPPASDAQIASMTPV